MHMREILFRGKSLNPQWVIPKEQNGWVYGVPVPIKIDSYETDRVELTECHGYDELDDYELLSEDDEVDPKTIGQYTGLKDKNGTKIFEDDVVKTKFGRLCIVEWFSTRVYCGWDLKPIQTSHNICTTEPPTEYDLWEDKNLEVVGNIHDNPEFV